MQKLLYLPRLALLTFLFLSGPLFLVVSIILIQIESETFWRAGIFGLTMSTLYFFVKTKNILKPSKAFIDNPIHSSIKSVNASKKWAQDKVRDLYEAKNVIKGKLNDTIKFNEEKIIFLDSIKNKSIIKPIDVVILGGSGWESKKDNKFLFSINTLNIIMSDLALLKETTINSDDLKEISISGPGKVESNAGVIGGGFGVEGALKGMATATIVNLLTTYSSTKTFIRLGFINSEIIMLTSQIEPDQARILLSPLFLKINSKPTKEKKSSLSEEIQSLHNLKKNGTITDEEFEKLKRKIIG